MGCGADALDCYVLIHDTVPSLATGCDPAKTMIIHVLSKGFAPNVWFGS